MNLVLNMMKDMFGIKDFAPLGLSLIYFERPPEALLRASDHRTFGASIGPCCNIETFAK